MGIKMSKEKSAVEWLVKQLYNHQYHIDLLDVARINGYFEQAKELEKKNINSTAVNCYTEGFRDRGKGVTSKELMSYYEGYYDRTFGDTPQSDE
jgi:hypothetical protein